ncbi:hypothetical protein FS837_001304 [Tulasnella sp. UAMH 9824]|nr:hypothetical protein FS837_001304 [Tulasnella sp. UAMH 9824]
MQPGYSPFQLWFLTFLRKLVVSMQQLLQLAAANPSRPPPLQYDPEPDAPIDFEKLRPTLDPKRSEDGTTTLQRARALLAWLIRFYLHFTSPQANAEIGVPSPGSIAHSLNRE